ncbi:MAG: hypothetical protein P8N76_00265 [Pirellulaceae bacterium]|nr:hypothetical protein [Pirellulaceae bacterium]
MKPIAPRHLNTPTKEDEPTRVARPILTIPNWNHQPMEMVETDGEKIDFEAAASGKMPENSQLSDSPKNEKTGTEKRLRDTIHVYWSTARSQAELKLPRRLPEAIRGILPGIGIAISLIFVWFFIQGRSSQPTPNDLVNQDSSTVIKPITEAPLRKSENQSLAVTQPDRQKITNADPPSEALFNNVSIIERNAPPVSPKTQVTQAEISSRERVDIASRTAIESTFAKTKSRPSRTTVAPTTRLNQSEWPRNENKSAPALDPLTIEQRPVVETNLNQVPQANRTPTFRRRELQPSRPQTVEPYTQDLQPQYSYQTTDPSTYKDPDYVVPPVTRRTARE